MLKHLSKTITVLFLVLALVVQLPPPVSAEISIEQEKEMGEKFLKAARQHLQFIEDPEIVDYVNRIGQRLVRHLDAHTFPYRFYVVDSAALNAFAAPAGHVFINRGLLEIMESEGELAAILAHEIAHVQSRHIAQRLARSQKLNLATLGAILAGMFLGGGSPEASKAVIAGSLAGSTSLQLSYSRQDEEEADRKGLRYLEDAGYPGQDMVAVFKKMSQKSWQGGGRLPTYLSTHPGVPERVGYLATVLETRQASSYPSGDSPESIQGFRMMQAKLLGAYQDPPEAAARLRPWLEQPETRVMGLYGLALVKRRQGKMEEAASTLKQAISRRPDLTPLLVELGETYFRMGSLEKAFSVLQSALSLEPEQPAALYSMGRVLLESGDQSEACTYLARAAQINDRLPSIHYYLGLAYGRLNRLGQAHYHFGIHNQREGSRKSALFHYREALRLTENPALRKDIEDAMKDLQDQERSETREGSRERRRF